LSAFFEGYETSTNQISRSYHEGNTSYQLKKKLTFIIRSNFLQLFFSLYRNYNKRYWHVFASLFAIL